MRKIIEKNLVFHIFWGPKKRLQKENKYICFLCVLEPRWTIVPNLIHFGKISNTFFDINPLPLLYYSMYVFPT